jgi:hypothetical protein
MSKSLFIISYSIDKVNNPVFNILMEITYPSHHRWQRDVSNDPFEHFSPRTAGKIRTALGLCPETGVSYNIKPLDEEFLAQFVPLYTEHISGKANAIVHDVYTKTLGKETPPFPYYALSLLEQGDFIGGTIFSLRPDQMSFAYRAFNPIWKQANLKISPAYVAEYVAAEFAVQNNLSTISHGKDRNPYGLGAAIGLAIFKLSVGCHAFVVEKCEVKTLDPSTIDDDVLVLIPPSSDATAITKALLITSRASEHKYLQVTKYPEQLTVEVLYRD